jgi:toxin ParE1/3/4
MLNLIKRAVVIQDLIDISTYISRDNLDSGDRFLYAAEATFQQIAKLPGIGKLSGFTHPKLTQVRQYPVKGFKNYLIYYQIQGEIVDVMHVL